MMKKRGKPRRIRGSSEFRWKSGCAKLLKSNLVEEDVLQDGRSFCAFHGETCTQFINFQISNLDSDRDSIIVKNNIRRDFLQLKGNDIAR